MKTLALLSGLDSILAVKLIQEQGIDVIGFYFNSDFFNSKIPLDIAKQLGIKLYIFKNDKQYLKILKKPKYGYGSGINPCIDCKIFIMKNAKKYMKKIKAKFIITGEVLGERPMSQHREALDIIEKEAGLKGYLLRPLTAKNLPETIPEKKGWINRNKLLAMKGRGRKKQFELANKYNINYYPSPAGGCLLTQKEFASKVRDLFKHNKKIKENDIKLLKLGRHFRYHENKIIVGRNEKENKELLKLKNSSIVFEVPKVGSPITLLQGKSKENIIKAAQLTAFYSDNKDEKVKVNYNNKSIIISKINKEEVDKLRI